MNTQDYKNAAIELREFRFEMYWHTRPYPLVLSYEELTIGDALMEIFRGCEMIRIQIETIIQSPISSILKILIAIIHIVMVLAALIEFMKSTIEYLDEKGCYPRSYRMLYLDPNPQLLLENL